MKHLPLVTAIFVSGWLVVENHPLFGFVAGLLALLLAFDLMDC